MHHNTALVLDTHIWVWSLTEGNAIPEATIDCIKRKASQGNLYIPAIVVWEVSMLAQKKRLTFSMPISQWINEALSQPGIKLASLTPEIAVESCQLPGDFHGDPADRMIVATTRILGATLITHDRKILTYAAQGYLNAQA